jgi:hypothetical protein
VKRLNAWSPQPGPQSEAIAATWCRELLFGGARGGGKSDFLLGDFLQDVPRYGRNWQGILFRKTYKQLEELIRRAKSIFLPTGAEWLKSEHMFLWENGASLKLRHLDSEDDAEEYQGHQYTWIGFDEITHWASDGAYKKLSACLRWAEADVPTKRIRCSGNPGGAGHHWVKARFIDHAPLGHKPRRDPHTEAWIMFIPSKVTDNKILLRNDPSYIANLRGVGSPQLVRAWLDGDWSVITGAFFTEFEEVHIKRPVILPAHWTRFRAFDWGSAKPFSVGWYAVSDGTLKQFPKGALIKYREWYGCSEPNVGLKKTVEEVGDGIKLREIGETITYGVADPSIFAEEGGPSYAERLRTRGVSFRPADNKRISGWEEIRSRLVGDEEGPMIYFFSTCAHTIRTLPAVQHDEAKAEDIDTDGEDHAADETRYAVMSRPWVKPKQHKPVVKTLESMTYKDLVPVREQSNGRI